MTTASPGVKIEIRNGRAVCPICHRETKTRVEPDTVLRNFKLFCPLCRIETKVDYGEPEPESQSR